MRRSYLLVFLLALLAACGASGQPRLVAPLSYAPLPTPPDEPFRNQPPAAGPLDVAPMFGLAKTHLSNGMEVIQIERHGLPVLAMSLVIQRGARDLPTERAEVLALAMDGLEREHQSALDAATDVRPTAACGVDGCLVSVRCLSGSLDNAMKALADIAIRPRYSGGQASRLRDDWKSWLSHRRGTTEDVVDTNVRALLFVPGDVEAPAQQSTANAVEALTIDHMREVHAQLFQPAHATLVVAGDTTPDALHAAAERAFGAWQMTRAGLPMTAAAPPIPPPWARTILVDAPGELVHAYVAARAPAGNEAALDAIVLLAALLSTPKGQLQEEVRSHLGAAYDLSLDMNYRRTGSWFMLGGAFEPNRALPAIAAVLQAIRTARDQGVSAPDLEGARTRAIAELRSASGTSAGAASLVSATLLAGAPPESVLTRQSRLASLTATDVQRVAQVWLAEPLLRVVVVGPANRLVQPFDQLGLGPVQWRGKSSEAVSR